MPLKTLLKGNTIVEEDEEEEKSPEINLSEEEEEEEEPFQERIIIASPKASVSSTAEEIPISADSAKSFHEKILEASPDLADELELIPCNTCARKFNYHALQRHAKVCEKSQSKPRKIFDAINKVWKSETEREKTAFKTRSSSLPRRKKSSNPEEDYQMCDYCRRRFCSNAFDRHVEFCRDKSTRIQTSPAKDVLAQAKLLVRTKYKPPPPGAKQESPTRRTSLTSLFSESSLPPWNFNSGRNTPAYRSLSRNEGSGRELEKRSIFSGTRSLGRADGIRYARQGDASINSSNDEEWLPEKSPKATTLSREASGRGSIRKPALTKAALLRLSAGEKKAVEEEKKHKSNEFGMNSSTGGDYKHHNDFRVRSRSRTPSYSFVNNAQNNMMTRSAHDYYRSDRGSVETPRLMRRSSSRSRMGMESVSPFRYEPSPTASLYRPASPSSAHSYSFMQSRAEPDGIEHDDTETRKISGEYDHSREYDPYQQAERQMQELLFGTGCIATGRKNSDENKSSQSFSNNLQKPKPVRPSATSAFSVYSPGSRSDQGIGPVKATRSYLFSPKLGRDYTSQKQPYSSLVHTSSNSQDRKLSSPLDQPSKYPHYLGLRVLSEPKSQSNNHDYLSGLDKLAASADVEYLRLSEGSGGGRNEINESSPVAPLLTRNRNWADLFPSLSRTPGTPLTDSGSSKPHGIHRGASERRQPRKGLPDQELPLARPAGDVMDYSDAGGGVASPARFCHECGNPFQLPSIRFCCECGVKRLYF